MDQRTWRVSFFPSQMADQVNRVSFYFSSVAFVCFPCTYRGTLRPSDSGWTPVPLHAPWSRCARRPLDARLTSTALWPSTSSFTRVAGLNRKMKCKTEESIPSCSDLTPQKDLDEPTSPLAPGSPGSPCETTLKDKMSDVYTELAVAAIYNQRH